jgi:hypothetical protein
MEEVSIAREGPLSANDGGGRRIVTGHVQSILALPLGSMTQTFDVIVLGAGAAGLMCAIEAG